MVAWRQSLPSWKTAAVVTTTSSTNTRADVESNVLPVSNPMSSSKINREESEAEAKLKQIMTSTATPDVNLSLVERALSAAGAAFLSAIIVNPLDVAKTRLQAQAAGVPYDRSLCGEACLETQMFPELKSLQPRPLCTPECNRYTGTLDVFYKVIRQEGFRRLWRGTNASLALAIPSVGIYMPCYDIFRNSMEDFTVRNFPALTPYVPLVSGAVARSIACVICYPVELARTRMQAFRVAHIDAKPPGVLKTLVEVINPVRSANNLQNLNNYRLLWTGLGMQLARDVPFSAICWSTLEPTRRRLLAMVGDEANAASILGANFSAGFVAGTLASAATCPLDVARTRRQIEKDPTRALNMTMRQTLLEIWRDGGMRGLFAGVGPRVARAGPSVGIVVSFYEVVKYALHHWHLND